MNTVATSKEFHQKIVMELQSKNVILSGQETGNRTLVKKKKDMWHDTRQLLEVYRKANWAITNEIVNLASFNRDTASSKLFRNIDKFSEVLREIIQENVDEDYMQKDRSKTLERAKSLSLSLLLLQDMQAALERIQDYPQFGQAYFKILYYSYFSNLSGGELLQRRSPGYRTVVKYAQMDNDEIQYDERRFYQLRDEALALYDTLLWGLTSRETVRVFIDMYQKML